MDEHRNIKVAVLECTRDVVEVHFDVVAAGRVAGVVRFDLDRATVCSEKEVVGGFGLRKAHPLFAAMDHGVVIGGGSGDFGPFREQGTSGTVSTVC